VSSAPPPPPPPGFAPKDSSSKNSAHVPPVPPPPAPFGNGLTKAGGAAPQSYSGLSNGNIPPIPGPPSGAPFSTKGRGLSRPSPRNQAQTKKSNLKPYHWLKLTRAMQGSLWAESQKADEASKYSSSFSTISSLSFQFVQFLWTFNCFYPVLSVSGLQSLTCQNLRVFSLQLRQIQIMEAQVENQIAVPLELSLKKFSWSVFNSTKMELIVRSLHFIYSKICFYTLLELT
jgi:hypothetical protein